MISALRIITTFPISLFRRGILSFLFFSIVSTSYGMEFHTILLDDVCSEHKCRRAVIATGEITPDAPESFLQFLEQERDLPGLDALIFMHSPGGNVESALRLGSIFHDKEMMVVVGQPVDSTLKEQEIKSKHSESIGVIPGHCASACIYTLMGAKYRVVPYGARLGVHRMSAQTLQVDPAGGEVRKNRVYAGPLELNALRNYVAEMGGSQELISLAESIPSDQIRILSDVEMRKYKLVSKQ